MQKAAVKKKAKVRTGRRTADYYDYNLLAAVILLVCFGLVMLYSTSSYEAQLKFEGNDMYYFTRQAVISAAAILLAVLVSRLDYHLLIPVSGLAYVGSLVLMAMVKYTPLGVSAYGARRWLNLGIQFQPSEVAKIAVIIYLPVVIIKMGRQFKTLKAVMVLLGLGALQAVAALVWTDNLSTGLIIGGIAVLMIFVAHPDTKWFVGVGSVIAAVVGIAVAYMGMTMTTSDNFRIRRILSWLHPEENMSGGGYQVMQSLYAIGSGGFFGKGLGNSAQKLGTIPEAQNDMIFSIVCEEFGLLGALLLMLLFLLLVWRLLMIAVHVPDLLGSLIAAGIMGHILIQVILNIAVVTNTIPNTGITLPFVSYGGTSVLFLLSEMGLALNVSRHVRQEP